MSVIGVSPWENISRACCLCKDFLCFTLELRMRMWENYLGVVRIFILNEILVHRSMRYDSFRSLIRVAIVCVSMSKWNHQGWQTSTQGNLACCDCMVLVSITSYCVKGCTFWPTQRDATRLEFSKHHEMLMLLMVMFLGGKFKILICSSLGAYGIKLQ
jgi:hypothetical protein